MKKLPVRIPDDRLTPAESNLEFRLQQSMRRRTFNMNSDQFEGKWKQLKGTVKQRWGKLTDDDVTALSGKKDELVGKIHERYGITREQAEREADEWARASASEIRQTQTASKF